MKSARLSAGGTANNRAQRAGAQRDPYPLPAQSLRPDPVTDDTRSRIAGAFVTIFLSAVFLIPMVLAGIMMGSR